MLILMHVFELLVGTDGLVGCYGRPEAERNLLVL